MNINAIRIFSRAAMALEKMRRLPAIRNGRLVEAVSRGYIRKVALI
ncbi:MAG: hypothetical protein O2817_01965 [Proteobacteria bacterium]|nr:hypothetical protein [Pseudomonadota bacterium]